MPGPPSTVDLHPLTEEDVRLLERLHHVAEQGRARLRATEIVFEPPGASPDKAIETLLDAAAQLMTLSQDMGLPRLQLGSNATVVSIARASMLFLKVGEGPGRFLDINQLDLTDLSEQEMAAIREMEGEELIDFPEPPQIEAPPDGTAKPS